MPLTVIGTVTAVVATLLKLALTVTVCVPLLPSVVEAVVVQESLIQVWQLKSLIMLLVAPLFLVRQILQLDLLELGLVLTRSLPHLPRVLLLY